MSRTGALPEPLKLKKHLDACTVAELEEFVRFWSPHFKQTNGRAQLVEELYRLMSDENVVYAKVDLLSEKVRAVLLQLLQQMHYVSDLQGLFRGVDGLAMEYYEAEAALTALARRGFVRQSRGQEWLHYGRASYAIPQETALVMRGLAGIDRRPLEQVFVHETFRPSGVEAAGNEPHAALPESVTDAVGTLKGPLPGVVTEILETMGGICTRHEFAERFGGRGIRWNSASFLRELGRRGLGTVGHLDLRARGIGVEDDALFCFSEAVERYAAEWRTRGVEHDVVLTAHGDLMSDLRTALAEIRDASIKVAKEGSVYKSARARLAEKLQFHLQPLLDRTEVAERVLSVARGLGLAERNGDGHLALTEKGEAWEDRPLLAKVKEAYGLLLHDGEATLRTHHLRGVHKILVDLLVNDPDPEAFWPGASAALLARNRYLLALAAEEPPPVTAPLSIRHAAVSELGRAARDLLCKDLFALGLVDVALRGQEPAGVRLSGLGRRLLRGEKPAEPARPLVVNPDFELIVLPEGDVDDLLHELDRVAVRERTAQVVHYRIEKERVERAAVAGTGGEEILALLTAHARAELPQNVVYSIRSWSGGVRSATLERGVLFVASDPSVVEAVRNHPVLKECILRVVEPATIFFTEQVIERQLVQELKSLGIYVR